MSDLVGSNVVDISMSKSFNVKLRDYIEKLDTFPISIFYKTSILQALNDGIDFLTSRKSGNLYIPSDTDNPEVRIIATEDKNGSTILNYITTNYRYPINEEQRPYDGGDWKVGDIILNNDISTNGCLAWICTEEGTPGAWRMTGTITPWVSYVEVVTTLPEASELQFGRKLIYSNEELHKYDGQAVICLLVNQEYKWLCQNTAIGTLDERPETLPFLGWYLDLDNLSTYFFDGTKWITTFEGTSNHSNESINSESGVHGLRIVDGFIVYQDEEGNWISTENNHPVISTTQPDNTGVLWIDTSSGSAIIKFYDGKKWTEASALSTSKCFLVSDTQPSDTTALWIDTSESNPTIKFYHGSEWKQASSSSSSSSTSSKVFEVGTTAPDNTGVLWIDTSSGGSIIKYHNGTEWVGTNTTWA